MQKLVTVYIDNAAYMSESKWVTTSFRDKHGFAEEHLQSYLDDGWKIMALHGLGSANDGIMARGWLAVVLEK